MADNGGENPIEARANHDLGGGLYNAFDPFPIGTGCGKLHPFTKNPLVVPGKGRATLEVIQRFTGVTAREIITNQRFGISPFGLVGGARIIVRVAQHGGFSV